MKFKIPFLTRREFIKKATVAGAAVSGPGILAPTILQTRTIETGKKGQTYPDQRRKHKDSRSGHTVWQLTDTPGRTTQTLYFTNRHATSDSRWLIYASDRSGPEGRFNLFKMDLRTGESVQLTESGVVVPHSPDISYDGKELYYYERGNSFRVINLETLQEREICKLDENVQASHALSVNADHRFVIVAPVLERKRKLGYQFSPYAIRSALIVIRTDNGKSHNFIDGMSRLGHVAYSPTNPNQILYSIHLDWHETQRPWLINADGSGNRPILPQHQGEGIGHEFWGASGRTVIATCFGGRQPQGLWAADVNSGNERCVLAGATIAHGTASPEEDRFVGDEIYGDTTSLWIARKGSSEPKLLCQMPTDWFATRPDGNIEATRHHPHPRFLPNGQGVTFSSGGEIHLVEL